MKNLFILLLLCFAGIGSRAQFIAKIIVKNAGTREALPAATAVVKTPEKTAVADSSGLIMFTDLPAGKIAVTVSYSGMETQEINITLPQSEPLTVLLSEAEDEEEEVIVTSTRTSRSIRDIPTRVEIILGEELEEKGNMKPGDIRMLLNESTGIQTQQTSATSYNSSIRIQGLDGRYTQIIRDGFPLYSGFSGGLSLMQIAPLDLKQIEVIKGSASTLYGGGAIAGLVNLVSKTPQEKREISLLANATSALGLDLSAFYSQKFKRIGLTVFGSRNTGRQYDPAGIGFTAIPKFERYTINPRVFYYSKNSEANLGFSYITEDRLGGSMNYIKNGTAGYFERNNTKRFSTQAEFIHHLNDRAQLVFKNSYSRFNRSITIPAYSFAGIQQSTFSELNYSLRSNQLTWVGGVNFLTDDFNERARRSALPRNYHYNTAGLFLQNTWTPSARFSLETGLRGDYIKQFGFVLLPRVSAMWKPASSLTARLGGGSGYKAPTIFNEESEKRQFQWLLPIPEDFIKFEKSAGASFDVNYRLRIGEIGVTINQLFFYTRLNSPLILTGRDSVALGFGNANGHISTKGFETNLKLAYSDFKLFVGYTYADVNSYFFDQKNWFPLTARHRLNNVLMYEKEEKIKLGLEAYHFSKQRLSNGLTGKPYWIFGFMAEKFWEQFSLFVNFENFTDTRQSRMDKIFTGSTLSPNFNDIYAPVDGFVVNGGIKVRL